jgi:Tfp pilus assembly protein FimT
MLELMISMAIVLILSALALPTINVIRSAKLREAGSNYAGLLQNARITAIQNDAYYSVVSTTMHTVPEAFIDLNGNGRLDQGEPVIALPSNVLQRTYADNPPALANLETQTLASSNDPSLDTVDNPTFGPRGLPCRPVTAGGYTTCLAFSGAVAGTSFISFFQSEPDGTWLAVILNPSARVRIYKYNKTSWSPVQ